MWSVLGDVDTGENKKVACLGKPLPMLDGDYTIALENTQVSVKPPHWSTQVTKVVLQGPAGKPTTIAPPKDQQGSVSVPFTVADGHVTTVTFYVHKETPARPG